MSVSNARAPARRLGIEHPLQDHNPRLHLARRLVELAEAALVLGRELPAPAPAREVMRDDPDRRDDDQEDDAEDKGDHMLHSRHRAGIGRGPLPSRALSSASSSSTRESFSMPASSSASVALRPSSNDSTRPSISSSARSTCSKRAKASVIRSS